MKNASQPVFEIPDTEKSRAFVARNPQFPAALLKLFETANKCFGRDPRSKNHLENVCFWLGHTCRQDFLEIVFLAINGYGAGVTKKSDPCRMKMVGTWGLEPQTSTVSRCQRC
jgi:hypothetical protein